MENSCSFLLVKEKTWKLTFNINIELLQNRSEKQIMPFKTAVNWLFNDMWRYLVIAFLWLKIGVFQETLVRVYCILNFNPILDGPFRSCSWMRGSKRLPLSKICRAYPTLMKLGTVIPYLKKIQKIHKSHDTPWVLLTSAFFHRKSTIFSISGNTSIDCILMHIF